MHLHVTQRVTDAITLKCILQFYEEYIVCKINKSQCFRFCFAIKLTIYKSEVNKMLRSLGCKMDLVLVLVLGDMDLHLKPIKRYDFVLN